MLVWAQMESKEAWENLDGILAVDGLTGITGGPNDLAASLGHPGEPDHLDRVAATADAEARCRAAGKMVAGDLTIVTGAAELMLGPARDFVEANRTKV